ncbi:MAG: hypothetical protein UT66_C0018G0018 [candidate division CPR2 bacterium GW2011_GWC1_39_9]|uniref:RNase III domain-containing protein n=1 Tax=candidate division CPR2 bacterium GW2011_GWC2_39_10 TaxID=1618345 RepID=A0A0G0P754_UNCC2|nr:MAG: hypothetical protein UT18_C0013G0016 [candidate division CPR2 bacterium GW2011_GWC2_39_10]KKR34679.1 MAG: hypothetical protein UT66_C0018G0018 [candidate division CPR2 bacterium GW2011_GWC1_39_9]
MKALSQVCESTVKQIQERLGISLNDENLLVKAILPKMELEGQLKEFFGDRILAYILTQHIHRNYPHLNVTQAHKILSRLAQNKSFADAFSDFGIKDLVEINVNSNVGLKKAADRFEALIAILHEDRGLDYASSFVLSIFGPKIDKMAASGVQELEGDREGFETNRQRKYLEKILRGQVILRYNYFTSDESPKNEAVLIVNGKEYGREAGMSERKAKRAVIRQVYLTVQRRQELMNKTKFELLLRAKDHGLKGIMMLRKGDLALRLAGCPIELASEIIPKVA